MPERSLLRRILYVVGQVIARGYAIVLIVGLCYAGGRATAYLYRSAFKPVQTPPRFLAWQTPTDPSVLRDPTSPLSSPDSARAPVDHFHRVGRRPQADLQSGCLTAGCHEPLPHGDKMKLPAFANFHVGVLTCQMCHVEAKDRPAKAAWINVEDHEALDAPAALRLEALLSEKADKLRDQPAEFQTTLLALTRRVLEMRGRDDALEEIVADLETTQPGSPIWRAALKRLSVMVPGLSRLSSEARLIPAAQLSSYAAGNAHQRNLAEKYFVAAPDSAQRKDVLDQIHINVLKKPPACAACHADSPGMLDFAAVGYPATRARALGNLQFARVLDRVRSGGQFRLPQLVEGTNAK